MLMNKIISAAIIGGSLLATFKVVYTKTIGVAEKFTKCESVQEAQKAGEEFAGWAIEYADEYEKKGGR